MSENPSELRMRRRRIWDLITEVWFSLVHDLKGKGSIITSPRYGKVINEGFPIDDDHDPMDYYEEFQFIAKRVAQDAYELEEHTHTFYQEEGKSAQERHHVSVHTDSDTRKPMCYNRAELNDIFTRHSQNMYQKGYSDTQAQPFAFADYRQSHLNI